MLKKALFYSLWNLRNSKIRLAEKDLRESDFWQGKEYRVWQDSKLRQLLFHAYENSAFHRERIDACNVSLPDISVDTLSAMPVLEKKDLLEFGNRIQNFIPGDKHFVSETSGSTGEPLVFYRNSEWDAFHRASIYRGMRWHGVSPHEKNIYFWGYSFDRKEKIKTKFFDWLQNRVRIFSYDDESIKKLVPHLKKASYISGYSSGIYRLSMELEKQGLRFSPRLVKGTSEKIYDHYHDVSRKVFGKKIISEYGAAEAGIIAFECNEGSMHVNLETCIVEVVDGEVLVTNLFSKSFPIIRYSLGDSVSLSYEACPCGRERPIIKEITGRLGVPIKGYLDEYPSLTLYYIFKNIALCGGKKIVYQGVQKKKGALEIRVFSEVSSADESDIYSHAYSYFGNDLEVFVTTKCEFPKENKLKDFVSYLS